MENKNKFNRGKNNNIILPNNTNTLTKGNKMERKLEFDYELSYDIENLQSNSVEYLFHYLRFEVFPDIPEEKLKKLFYTLSFVGCREPDILKSIISFTQEKDFEGLLEFAETKQLQPKELLDIAQEEVDSCPVETNTNTNTNTRKKNTKIEVMYYKKPETMIDGWFVEENPYLAYSLFQHLIFSQQDDKYLKSFIENYKSLPPEGRKELVVYPKHHAVTV
jgi:hypothetical protein